MILKAIQDNLILNVKNDLYTCVEKNLNQYRLNWSKGQFRPLSSRGHYSDKVLRSIPNMFSELEKRL